MEVNDIKEADVSPLSLVGEATESPNSLVDMEENDTDKADTVQQRSDEKASGSQNLPVQSGEKESSINSQLGQKLATCMLHLYTSNMWTDIKFRCKDHVENENAEQIHAHKIVLAARSPFFQGMFFGPCAESSEGVVDLLTTEAEILDLVLRYIYSDETNLTEDTAVRVLKLAHMYQMPNLVKYCADFLSSVIVAENACEMFELALLYNQTKLRDAACAFIDNHAKQVMDSDGFLRISSDCLTYILKGDTLLENEGYIFKKAMDWADSNLSLSGVTVDGQSKRNVLGEAFFYLRIPTLGTSEFLRCTKGQGYYTIQEMENIIEYISDNMCDESLCHSVVARVPEEVEIRIPTLEKSTATSNSSPFQNSRGLEETYSRNINCTLLVSVSKDCTIFALSLRNICPYIFVKHNRSSGYEKDSLIDVTLDCVLRIDEIKFKTEFQMKQNESKRYILQKPILLGTKGTPYSLKFEIKIRSETSLIYFKTIAESSHVIGSCKSTSHTETCLNMHRTSLFASGLSANYCDSSSHFNCIDSFVVHHFPGRPSFSSETIQVKQSVDTIYKR